MSPLRIAEIFGPTIQGEGAVIGAATVFVRAGGCDYRCSWCDSLHAVDSAYRHTWAAMSTEDIWAKVVELSGGVPLTVLVLPRFSSGLFQAMFAMKETRNGNEIHRRVSS